MSQQPTPPPKAPNPNKLYQQGIQTYLQALPQLLQQEEQARLTYDPLYVQQQQQLQGQYGPTQYNQQLQALNQLDPTGQAVRQQLGNSVSQNLALGSKLDPQSENQLQTEIRNAQTARGNAFGNAPIAEEALFQGQAAQNLYQQRLADAGSFLAGQTPEQQIQAIQPVTPATQSEYVNPNAGYLGQQFGLQNYQNQLAYNQLYNNQPNPWATALGGAATGALAGSSFGPYGAVAGGLIGGLGGYFSDRRLKTGVKELYRDILGGVKAFRYKDDPTKQVYVGRIAQELQETSPESVEKDPATGFLKVSPEFAPLPV